MPERDPLDTFPNLTALPVLTTVGRAQLQAQNMPRTVFADHPTTKRMPTVGLIYEHTPMDKRMLQVGLPMRNTSATTDLHKVCLPDDAPEERIPPKPPYSLFPNTHMLWPQCDTLTFHERFANRERSTLLLTLHEPTIEDPLAVWKHQSPGRDMPEQTDTIGVATTTGKHTRRHGEFRLKDPVEENASILSTESTLAIDDPSTFHQDG